MSALTTEHYTLQSARASTIVEANGRSQLFLSAVSGATVALALVAQLDTLGETFLVFAFTILPALLALGVTSYIRLADLTVHDAYYARAIGRIRSFYLTIEPEARQYWLIKAGDDAHAVCGRQDSATDDGTTCPMLRRPSPPFWPCSPGSSPGSRYKPWQTPASVGRAWLDWGPPALS